MKLYTRRGDTGQTDLFGGGRVPKHHERVDAYGTVDELNAVVGLCRCCGGPEAVLGPLLTIQSRLFEIGADLATPRDPDAPQRDGGVPRIEQSHIDELERWIDTLHEPLPAMTTFVLPGGTELSARLHVARTVCRRAERVVTALATREPVGDALITYLNRLSDLLFAMARYVNHDAGVDDVPWLSPRKQKRAEQ